jgi:hypothetical protein
VAHPENPYVVPSNPIADDVRVNERQLAQIGARNGPTTLRKAFETVARSDQFSRQVLSSASIKPGDVIVDVTDVS